MFLIAVAALITGCGDEDPVQPAVNVADVNGYLADLPSWTDFSPQLGSMNEAIGPPEESSEQIGTTSYVCTSTPYSITETPDEIVTFNPDSEILWLGALLEGRGYSQGIGSLSELPIRQRAPLTLSIDLLFNDNSRTIDNPDLASVNQEIGALIQAAQDAGHRAGSSISFDQTTTYSLEQSALTLGISASYLGSDVRSRLDASSSREERTVTAYFTQRMFTTSVVLPQIPSEFFSGAFGQGDLQQQVDRGRIGPDNPPVFVSNIAWGRVLMFTVTSTASEDDLSAALNATYRSIGSGSIEARHLEILNESRIGLVTVGGEGRNALALLQSGQLSEYFAEDAALTSARPISYTVRNLSDNSIARVSETTEYMLTECTETETAPTGARYRVQLDSIKITQLGCDGFLSPSPEVYYTFWVGTVAGMGDPVASRSSSNTVTLDENRIYDINARSRNVDVYWNGRGFIQVRGQVFDEDSNSANELIGDFSMRYSGTGVPVGTRTVRRSGSGCGVELSYTIQKVGDLFD
jgi:hypothetical protein